MWREYSKSYIRNNKTYSSSVIITVMIASLFISFICTLFYNMWTDNIRRIISEEGDWQGKLSGAISEEDIETVKNYPNIRSVRIGEDEANYKELLITMKNPRSIYEDLPEIAGQIGLDTKGFHTAVQYHNLLLTQYYIYSPEERNNPPLLLSFYIGVMLLVCTSLILVIYHAFEMTGNERLHQLGILQSVGATPSQLRAALLQEAFLLSFLPVLVGIAAGIGLTYGFMQLANFASKMLGTDAATLDYHPLILLITFCACLLTVWIAAGRAARRLSKVSTLEAIHGGQEQSVRKVKPFRLFSAVFGVEWELARKFLYVRRRAYRTSALSLTISFLVFSIFLNFGALSELSTKYTYFERYKDTWDFMITVKENTDIDHSLLSEIRNIPEVYDCTGYQKAKAYTWLSEAALSNELKSIGGLEALEDTGTQKNGDRYYVEVPIIILDDLSYREYLQGIGLESSADMGVTVNIIWDNIHSNFRERKYLPYITEKNQVLTVFPDAGRRTAQEQVQLELNAFTEETPDLREEYEDFSLVQILPEHAYRKLSETVTAEEAYYKIRAISENELEKVQQQVKRLLEGKYEYELENRKEIEEYNAVVFRGYNFIIGSLCGLLALIGIANVFANTLGGVSLRKREFARYLSVGFTTAGLVKILAIEASIIGIKPILISLPFNVLFVIFAVDASELLYRDYFTVMPVGQLAVFAGAVLVSVGLAYYIAGRKLCRTDIVESLKDDTMY